MCLPRVIVSRYVADDGVVVLLLRLTGKKVALKEIRLQPEEGTPFTAIREGQSLIALWL